MCGLVAVVSKNRTGFTMDQRDAFTTLLYMDVFRGKDSTGAFLVNNLGNVMMAKQATSPDAFINSVEYESIKSEAYSTGWAMVGHNRAATRGIINDVNAHPFVVDDKIVLVHNGTFNGCHKKIKDTDVDSEAIAHLLSNEPDVEKALQQVNAAYALIWYNVDTKQLCVIRNNQRPLWYVETKDAYYMASENAFLDFIISRQLLTPVKEGGPFMLKENVLNTFSLQEDKSTELTSIGIDNSYVVSTGVAPANGFRGYGGHWGEYDGAEYDAQYHMERHHGQMDKPATPLVLYGSKNNKVRLDIATTLGENIKPVTMGEYSTIHGGFYGARKLIKVVVTEIIEADDTPRTTNFILIGKTLDMHEMHCVFPYKIKSSAELDQFNNDVIFEVQNDGLTWQRVETIHNDPAVIGDDVRGLCLVHGKGAVPILSEIIDA